MAGEQRPGGDLESSVLPEIGQLLETECPFEPAVVTSTQQRSSHFDCTQQQFMTQRLLRDLEYNPPARNILVGVAS
ncbi:hypothetical protein ACFYWO_38665 [Streptomyces sp. NPDC002932]|uniref:hypothetical protein n=1 Tax=Streptomyces sp. NPDC002932 TaxID=3364672 RepID=UPI00367B8361